MESPAAAPGFVPAFIDAGEGITFKMLGTTMRLIATAAETAGRYTVLEQVTPVGWGPPRHIHSREDEIFYILEGTYDVHCGGRAPRCFGWSMCHSSARSSTRLS